MSNLLDDFLTRDIEAAERSASTAFDDLINGRYEKELALESAKRLKAQEAVNTRTQKTVEVARKAGRDRTLGEIAQDTAIGLGAKGALAVGETAYGLADLISRFNPVTLADATQNYIDTGEFDAKNFRSLDEMTAGDDGQAMSQRLAETREILNEVQSDKLQAQRTRIQESAARRAEENALTRSEDDSFLEKAGQVVSDFGAAVGDYIENPSAALDTTLESVPQMLVPGGIAKELTKNQAKKQLKQNIKDQTEKGAGNLAEHNAKRTTAKFLASKEGKEATEKLAERAGVSFAVASEGISNGIQIQAQVLNTSHEELLDTSPAYQELLDRGMSQQEARRALADEASLITTGLAGLTGGLTSKFTGAGKLEGQLFKENSAIAKNILTKTVTSATKEGAEETLQEGVGQFAQNVGVKTSRVNPEQDLGEGVIDSAAGGLVAGATSGGGLAAIANAPKAAKTAVDGTTKATKKVVEKADEVLEARAAKNSGVTKNVREALKTGNEEKVMAKNKKGEFENPMDTATYLLEKGAPEDPAKRKQHIMDIRVAIGEFSEKENMTKAEKDLMFKRLSEVKALEQSQKATTATETKDFMTRANGGDVENTKANRQIAQDLGDSLGTDDITSRGMAKNIIKDSEAVIKSGVATPETKQRLEKVIATAKTMSAATKEIFNGEGKFLGINSHRKIIAAQHTAGNKKSTEQSLARLKNFRDGHKAKLKTLSDAWEVQQTLTDGRKRADLSADQEAVIAKAENLKTLGGDNYFIGASTGNLVGSIQQEVKALDAAVDEMESLVSTTATKTESGPDTELRDVLVSESTTGASDNAPSAINYDVDGPGLLQQASDAGLKIPAGVRKNPSHRASIKSLKAKLQAYEKTLGVDNEARDGDSKSPVEAVKEPSDRGMGPKELKKAANMATTGINPNDRVAYLAARNAVYDKEYARTVAMAAKKGIEPHEKVLNKIKNGNYKNVSYVESAIDSLNQLMNKVDRNKQLGKDFTDLEKRAEKMGLFVRPADKELVKTQDPKNVNIIPKVVERLKEKVERVEKEYDVRKVFLDDERAASFTWDRSAPKNLLQDTPKGIDQLRDALKEDRLPESEKVPARELLKFHDNFKVQLLRGMALRPNKYAYKDPLGMFIQNPEFDPKNVTEADIDPNVVSAIALASFNWIATKGRGTMINDARSINTLLGRDTKSPISDYENNMLQDVGVGYRGVVRQELGPEVIRMLGLKIKDNAPLDDLAALENSFTNHAMNTLQQMGLIEFIGVPSDAIEMMIEGKPESVIKEKLENSKSPAYTPFVRIKTQTVKQDGFDNTVPSAEVQQHIDTMGSMKDTLETMFATRSYETAPVFEKPKNSPDAVVDSVRNSPQEVSGEVQQKMAKEQQTEWTLNRVLLDVTDWLGSERDLTIAGAKDSSQMHQVRHKGVDGKNRTLARDLSDLKNLREKVGDSKVAMWFKKQVWKSGRMGFDSNTVNPQSSHHHRNVVSITQHENEIDTSNPAQEVLFLRSVAASMGIKTEKMNDEGMKQALREKFQGDVFKDALRVLTDRKNNTSDAAKNAVVTAVNEGGEAHWSLAGLVAYADYAKAKKTGGKFKTRLYREPDGITNGIAISLLQMPSDNMAKNLSRLARVGIYADGTGGYFQYSQSPDAMDAYEGIAEQWGKHLQSMREHLLNNDSPDDKVIKRGLDDLRSAFGTSDIVERFDLMSELVGSFEDADTGGISKIGRNLSKNPLMTNNYGASIKKIIENFAQDRLFNIYDQIAEAGAQGDVDAIRSLVNQLARATATKLDAEKAVKNPTTWQLTKVQEENFVYVVSAMYGSTVEAAIDSEYGDIINARKTINKGMGLAFEAFQHQYRTRYDKLVKEADGKLPSKNDVKALNKELLKAMPIFKGVFSDSPENGLLILKQELTNSNKHRTQSQFNDSAKSEITLKDANGDRSSKPEKNNSLSLYARKTDWGDGGVAGPITAIHNIDSATMLETISEHVAGNIHDAFLGDILNSNEVAESMNRNFYNINKDHSVVTELYKAFHNSLVALNKFDKAKYNKLYKDNVELVGEFQNLVKTNRKNRRDLFNQITVVDQYTDGPGTAYDLEAEEQAGRDAQNEALKVMEKEFSRVVDSLGSTTNVSFSKNFQADWERTITQKNAQDIFEALGQDDPVKDSSGHVDHLRSIMGDIVSKVIKPTKLFVREQGNVNVGEFKMKSGAIFMSNAMPQSQSAVSTRMSQKEVYVHEVLHAVTHTAIDSNSLQARQLRKYFNEIRDARDANGKRWMRPEDFLAPGVSKTDADYKQQMQIAKFRYDYVFKGGAGRHTKKVLNPLTNKLEDVVVVNAHHEFLVMAVTNEAFRQKLSKYDAEVKANKEAPGTWMETFTQWVRDLLNKFSNRRLFAKDSKATLDTKMVLLAGQLAGIDNRHKNHLWMAMERMGSLVHAGLDTAVNTMLAPIKMVVNSETLKNSKYKLVRRSREVVESLPNIDKVIEFQQRVRDASGAVNQNVFHATLHEIIGATDENIELHDLSRLSGNFVDRVRMKYKTQMAAFVRASFKSELTQDRNEALSRLLKADVAALGKDDGEGNIKFDGDLLQKLYESPAAVDKEIKRVVKELENEFGKGKQTKYYHNMAASLGHMMMTGRPIQRVAIMNTQIIAEMKGLKQKPKGDIAKAQELIDELGSLYAIAFTPTEIRKTIAETISDEYAADPLMNGIVSTLMLHRANQASARKELFNGDERLFVKGYTKELYSNNKSYMRAPARIAEELAKDGYKPVEDLATKGYTPIGEINKDPRDPNREKQTLYVSNIDTTGKWISGIVSMTSRRGKGTTISQVHAQAGEVDPGIAALVDRPLIKARKTRELQSIFDNDPQRSVGLLQDDENTLVPTYNRNGEMVEFRYMMTEATKNELLGKDNSLDQILGSMEANIFDKRNTKIINRQVVKATKKMFDKKIKSRRKDNRGYIRGFIEVGPNAPLKEYRNAYRMLPEEMKQDIREVWGGDSMFIKTEEASLVLGERELLISNLKWKDTKEVTNSVEWLTTQINNMAVLAFNNPIWGKQFKYVEQIWKEVIGMAKDAIVIKSGIVLLGNKISNVILLKTMGVSVKDIAKYHAEAFVGIQDHRRDSDELDKLRFTVKTDPSQANRLRNRMQELEHNLRVNPVTPLIDAGLYQHIVEDVNLHEQDNYQSRVGNWLKENKVTGGLIEKTPDSAKDLLKNVFMTHDTRAYQFMRDMTQASDFVARYTLHQHHLNNLDGKITPKQSIDLITKAFVNYTPPTHKWLQYANDMGFVMFSKFFLRIQGVLLYLAKHRPAALLGSILGQELIGMDLSDISDSVILGQGLGNRVMNPAVVAEQIITAPFSIAGIEEIIR